jgi:hypothetical protein
VQTLGSLTRAVVSCVLPWSMVSLNERHVENQFLLHCWVTGKGFEISQSRKISRRCAEALRRAANLRRRNRRPTAARPCTHKSSLVSGGWSMSALPPEADIRQRIEHVCFVPLADIVMPLTCRGGQKVPA